VPRDLSIIGFDDFPAAQYSIPPLTSMRQPIDDMGVLAVKRLIEHAATQRGVAMQQDHAVVPHSLVVRASTCPPPRAASPRRTKA
jgi:DNA-binding LacI/PurR family transcriptional regulator